MWLLLQTVIKKLEIYNSDILIILDQYKCDKIDKDYRKLNDLTLLIEKNNECSFFINLNY